MSTSIHFDLHLLGWKAFEDLVACIFRDILGQTLQTFAYGPDGGRDAAFYGSWKDKPFTGSFTIQCKHTSKAGKSFSLNVVEDELTKVSRLAALGLAQNYLLVTNYSLPAGVAEEVEKEFQAAGAINAKLFGAEWISNTILENPRLRRLVPRLYGLGDLTQIVTHQAYRQARQVLDSIAADLACFVPTDAYRRSARALQEHGFVLLLGEPASGKTMIANLLALSAADEWDLLTMMVTSPADFTRLWNPDDPGQFMWVDDAFGATQYDSNRVSEWNHLLPKLSAAIRAGARVVFTSRDYIFAAAKRQLKISSFELFDDSRVVIEVEKLAEIERQMILYSHLKSGSQPLLFKKKVKAHLNKAVAVQKFLPEIARRFANPKFTQAVIGTESSVVDFFDKPLEILLSVVGGLAAPEAAAIALVFISGGKLAIPVVAEGQIATTLELLGVTLGEVKTAFSQLDDSLLKRTRETEREFWGFRHPTIRDAYATLIGGNPELIDLYLAGVSAEQMMKEVTCGVALEGAKIAVPAEKRQVVLEKLRTFEGPRNSWADPINTFLGTRCSAEFTAAYYETEDIRRCMPQGIWNLWMPDNGLEILVKLNRSGLLEEELRREAVDRIVNISVTDHSIRFAETPGVRELLTDEEALATARKVGTELLTNATQVFNDCATYWDKDDDPEGLFSEIEKTLEFIKDDIRFTAAEQQRAIELTQIMKSKIEHLRGQMAEKSYDKLETASASVSASTSAAQPPDARSIFDDVDE